MMRIRCGLHTQATPDQVFRAYTDFTDRRLRIWRDTLTPDSYELLDAGTGWAVAREGALRMRVVLRYEWSDPLSVRWRIVESTFCERGNGHLQIRPCASGAELSIRIGEYGGRGVTGRMLLGVKALVGPLVLPRTTRRALDRFAVEDR